MRPSLLLALLAIGCGAQSSMPAPGDKSVPAEADPTGEEEPFSIHHRLELDDRPITAASVEVRVDEVPRHGLRFFALQVNFADVAWAHGGLQADPGAGKANWGGLAPGIDYEYEGAEEEVLGRIQNMPGRTSDVPWELSTWYRYTVTRGGEESLPAGQYAVLDEAPRAVGARTMWRWDFEIREVETDRAVWNQHLFVAHAAITRITYWTETGYGIRCSDRLSIAWRNPLYWNGSDGEKRLPVRMTKSMDQSTCPRETTTDMFAEDLGGLWGTRQVYGAPRAPDSRTGDIIYPRD